MLLIVVLILCIVFIVISSTKLKLHAFLALLFAALAFGIFTGMPLNEIVESIKHRIWQYYRVYWNSNSCRNDNRGLSGIFGRGIYIG
jgi:H+/gluconate symporter-like permease